jgi:hypothetical protein
MTICGGSEVDTPPNRAWSAAKLAGMPEEIEVRAVHEVAPAACIDEWCGRAVRGLPSTSRRNRVGAEQNFGTWRYEQRSSPPSRPRSTNPSRRRRTLRGLRPTWGHGPSGR